MKTQFQTHDLTLSAWGPYTKKYSGISHIPAANDGVRFDLAVFPGLYRRRVDVPNVRFESGFHPWAAAPDLSCYTFRHELEWKDRVYADISFAPLGENARLIRAELHNRTEAPQNLVLHYMAACYDPVPSYRSFPVTGAKVSLPRGAAFCLAKDYEDLGFAVPRPMDHLGFDGMRRAEEAVEGFVSGYGLGQNFGCAAGRDFFGRELPAGRGDWVRFSLHLEQPLERPCLAVRYRNPSRESGAFLLDTGERLVLPPCREPQIVYLPLTSPLPAGEAQLTLTAQGLGGAKLDCLALMEMADRRQFRVTLREPGFTPRITAREDERFVLLSYPHAAGCYGLMWEYPMAELRQIENDDLDIFLRDTVQNHVSSVLRGNGKGHFTNIFQRPIPLEPGQSRVVYGAVCWAGSEAETESLCRALRGRWDTLESCWQVASRAMEPPAALPEGEKFSLGQRLMQAVLCTNVVYPVYTRSQYIRHNTPGRWWDSLYTWDSGFIGMGLSQYSLRRGFDCLRAYLTAPGDDECAFILHGSLVPTQFYLYAELLNQTGSRELAAWCYPRLRQYYRFLSGRDGSTTGKFASGILQPWDYFYNSGGWDDYPPQRAVHEGHLEGSCAPVITTAHTIRCAKILADTAELLGLAEAADYRADAESMTRALREYAWDPASGYFGYVLHDAAGRPQGILREAGGQNYNMGLGGASPLFAGACDEEQADLLWAKLEDGGRLWTPLGLSTVDQAAPYYREDGYWNGAVWVPYQWMFFKAALDAGRAPFALRLAQAQLSLWEAECRESYCCFEHFMIRTRRGAGWHQFSGLSSPIVQFYASLYRPGTLTPGFDTFVEEARWSEDRQRLTARLRCAAPGRRTILAVSAPEACRAETDVPGTEVATPWPGLWVLTCDPGEKKTFTLTIG